MEPRLPLIVTANKCEDLGTRLTLSLTLRVSGCEISCTTIPATYTGVSGLGCKLVPLLSLLIKEQHNSIHSANRQLAIVGSPGHCSYFSRTFLQCREPPDNLYSKYCALNDRDIFACSGKLQANRISPEAPLKS